MHICMPHISTSSCTSFEVETLTRFSEKGSLIYLEVQPGIWWLESWRCASTVHHKPAQEFQVLGIIMLSHDGCQFWIRHTSDERYNTVIYAYAFLPNRHKVPIHRSYFHQNFVFWGRTIAFTITDGATWIAWIHLYTYILGRHDSI